jgi:hypothetical protein
MRIVKILVSGRCSSAHVALLSAEALHLGDAGVAVAGYLDCKATIGTSRL